jgi:hypothetical protein
MSTRGAIFAPFRSLRSTVSDAAPGWWLVSGAGAVPRSLGRA